MGRTCRTCVARYAGQPGTGRCLGHLDGLRLFAARCGLDGKRFSRPAYESAHRLVLPRSGAYLLRVNGQEILVDSATAVLTRPGDELRVAHPLGCGDTFTAVELDSGTADRWPRDVCRLPLDDVADLHHRVLVATCRHGFDPLAAAERLYAVLDRLTPYADDRGPHRASTAVAHRRLVADAGAVLAEHRYACGLTEIAARVGCSPHHLSRIFRAVTGETLTDHRNRMRIRAVLTDLEDGADCLRSLAADYGFADQAHLTRVVRRHLGRSPSAIRRMIAPDRA